MNEIRCPHCGKVFQVDESGYAQLVKQVRDAEFSRDMAERERLLQQAHQNAVEAAEEKVRSQAQQQLAQRESEVASLKQQVEALQAQQDLAIKTAVAQIQLQRDALEAQLQHQKDEAAAQLQHQKDEAAAQLQRQQSEARLQQAEAQRAAQERAAQQESQLKERLSQQEARIAQLQQQLDSQEQTAQAQQQLAVSNATQQAQLRVVELEGQIKQVQTEREQAEAVLTVRMNEQVAAKEAQLRDKDAEIDRLRNQRARLTTKLIGESLEQHCEMEFNRWRATAFRNAEFHKDNDVVGGSKGDYVYREVDDDGVEVLSIMFEMKTEEEESTHHHKNADFFKKLDQDRRNKNCEYAVLVTMLEPENEFYNGGIADVSYEYPKMYVIRPQLFVPMITILRNAALNSLAARRELAAVRQQNIDVTNFEAKMEEFKRGFSGNYERASKKFSAAIQQIDKAIADLQKVRENLTASENQLRLANEKADGLTIRKLTWGNPTMREKFAEARALREQADGSFEVAEDEDEEDALEPDETEE